MINGRKFSEEDKKIIQTLNQALYELELQPPILLDISALSAWCLVLQIQVAGRCPGNESTWVYEQIKEFAHNLEKRLKMNNWLREYTSKGWNPEFDVTVPKEEIEDLSEIWEEIKPNEKQELKYCTDPNYILVEKHNFLINNAAFYQACSALCNLTGINPVAIGAELGELARKQVDSMSPAQVNKSIRQIIENCKCDVFIEQPQPPDEATDQ